MEKKKILKYFFICVVIVLNFMVCLFLNVKMFNETATLKIGVQVDQNVSIQFFSSDSEIFEESRSETSNLIPVGQTTELTFAGIEDSDLFYRIDLGDTIQNVRIYYLEIESEHVKQIIDVNNISNIVSMNNIEKMDASNGYLEITSNGIDPYIVFSLDNQERYDIARKQNNVINIIIHILLCVAIDCLAIIIIKDFNDMLKLPMEIVSCRKLILNLAKNDFKTRFAGSYLGIIWAFIQPLITTLVYWFVFEVGLRAGAMCDYPFILWLMGGLVPWFFFSEALNGGTNSLIEYNYLVKKVVFQISILPIVKIMSALFVNSFFIGLIMVLTWAYGYGPSIYNLQLIYYVLCSFVLVLGLSYLTSAIVGFFRDLSQIINIVLQVGIWITPIMWDASNMLSPFWANVFKINPMYYIVDGFRDSLLNKVWFWDKGLWTIYFWLFAITIYIVGTKIFRKLKIHFADVL